MAEGDLQTGSLRAVLDGLEPQGDAMLAPAPANWMQGRTAYGGFTAALLLGAVLRGDRDLPPLRSAMINFTGPVSASPRLTTETLRRGRNVTSIAARARIDDQVAAAGLFSFGAAQDSHVRADAPRRDAPAPDACEPLIPPQAADFAPGFHRNFDLRLIEGDRPMTGSDRGYIRGWARHHDPASRTGIESLLCLADILPPAVFPLFRRMGPNSSMNWICNFLVENPETEDGWWLVETDLTAARDGFSSQVMRVWNSSGELVVDGMQSVAIFV